MTKTEFYNRIKDLTTRAMSDNHLGSVVRELVSDIERGSNQNVESNDSQYTLGQMITEVEQENRENGNRL